MINATRDQGQGGPHILLLTGRPGVGKTTVVRRVAQALAGTRLAGFYTEELRERGERRGFRLVDFAGDTHVIAHVDFPGRRRVGKYGVDTAALDAAAAALTPDPAVTVYLIDEIGKMECLSAPLSGALRAVLASGRPVVATVALRGEGLIGDVKLRPDAELWAIDNANRDAVPGRVLDWLALRGVHVRHPQPG